MQAQAPDLPRPVNKNLGPRQVNTNWMPGPVNKKLGSGPGGKARAGGQAEGRGLGNTNTLSNYLKVIQMTQR